MSSSEHWKPVPRYEGLYEVSDLGRIRRIAKTHSEKLNHVLSCPPGNHGYRQVGLKDSGRIEQTLVHRVVAEAFFGPCPTGCNVNHKDGDKLNNNVSNLEYIPVGENTKHAWRTGLCHPARGSDSGSVVINEADVPKIREMLINGQSVISIAKQFNVSRGAIYAIKYGRTWRHIA